ncbi:uncharacterized protein N7459_008983 [Penicillium hispanicum]|uniref:uncharacterized protein n=1 Tax=Penicillium hispanicum TaxID=1080232 RepID=UPI0025406851|nr:uncharacterized protein N7459_008983 [Penicillium hispanicum]KAJ5569553.1 hypothetical protein N7459_008983 [Penicillium hispanicum]
MRPSTKIHCVIPPVASTAPLPGNRALVARSRDSRYLLSPLQNRYHWLHRQASHPSDASRKRVPNHARKNLRFPAPEGTTHPSSPSFSRSSPLSTSSLVMSSDNAYMSFLDKANADLDAGRAAQQGADSARTETVDASVQVPAPLKTVDAYYISEVDEPFEPVALRWEGANRGIWPSADQLSSLISPNSDLSRAISTLSTSAFDPKNQYSSVFHAVRSAAVEKDNDADQSAVDVKVYRVELSSTKLEYWILALDAAEGRVVGLRAKSVES